MKFLLILILVSTYTQASSWSELELNHHYKLKQTIDLSQIERSHSEINLMLGEEFVLKEITPDMFVFEYVNCPGKAMETEWEIIPVQGTFPVVEVATQLKLCELNVSMRKDHSQSLFE